MCSIFPQFPCVVPFRQCKRRGLAFACDWYSNTTTGERLPKRHHAARFNVIEQAAPFIPVKLLLVSRLKKSNLLSC